MTLSEEEIQALHDERRAIMEEFFSPKAIQVERMELQRLTQLMQEADPEFLKTLSEAQSHIKFLVGETFGGDMGEDVYEYAREEIDALEKFIEESCLQRSETPGDFWTQYPAARLRHLAAQTAARGEMREDNRKRMQEIEALLAPPPNERRETPPEPVLDEADIKPFHMYFIPPSEAWNNAVRRIEYFVPWTMELLPDVDREPWDWTARQWSEYEEEIDKILPQELWTDPLEDAMEEYEALSEENTWLKIQLNREDRLAGEYKDKSEDRFDNMTKTLQSLSEKKYPPKKHWANDQQTTIERLQQMNLEGNVVEVLFNKRDPHAQRELLLRWGVDVKQLTRVQFEVSHYSHLNNYYGVLKLHGQPEKTVLLSLGIDHQNKVRVKTALRPHHEADDYLALERKHLPGGVGYMVYKPHQILAAHRKIMDELHGKKGPRD